MATISFGQRLRELRTVNHLSLRDLAQQIGVHYVYISQIERGLEKPSENLVKKIAELFHLANVDEMLLASGRIPADLRRYLLENPAEAPVLLREHIGGTPFLNKRREEIMQLWKRTCSNGMIEYTMIEQIRAMKQKSYDVSAAEALIETGHQLYEAGKIDMLLKHIALTKKALYNAPRIEDPQFQAPAGFTEISATWPSAEVDSYNCSNDTFYDRVHGGWLGKCIGGALGIPVEGWSHSRIMETYGEVRDYLSPPSTLNDDTSFEIVLLHALKEDGLDLTSEQLALEWLEHIPVAYTAEKIALENLKRGLMPPFSAATENPYSEWIGAQMRGEICGLIAPGRPRTAGDYAYRDAIISHERDGVYAEIYDAVLVSLAFVEKDPRKLLERALSFVPPHSRFAKVVRDVLDWCREAKTWREAWAKVEGSYLADYYWVHTFPNIAAVVIGLWFGHGDFTETICLTTMCGLDTDCTAGQAGAIVGTIFGAKKIPAKWKDPLNDRFESEVIGFESMSITEISRWTTEIGRQVCRRD